MRRRLYALFFFFFNRTATTEIYTLSLHDALPISRWSLPVTPPRWPTRSHVCVRTMRSEEHTSELQSRFDLVCRLLLEKKKRSSRRTMLPPELSRRQRLQVDRTPRCCGV